VIARPDAGITDAKSLVGKKIAVTPGDALTQVFPALLKANNIDRDKVELVFMDAQGREIETEWQDADLQIEPIHHPGRRAPKKAAPVFPSDRVILCRP
jgi:TRAP-type uncharacterized transport system substrate-binding protein